MAIESSKDSPDNERRSQDTSRNGRTDGQHNQNEFKDDIDEEVKAGQWMTPQVPI